MNKKQIKKIATKVIKKQYPEMKGIEPEIEKVDTEIGKSTFAKAGIPPIAGEKIWVATFSKEVTTEEGLPLNKITRITFDNTGNVIKISESK
jgi:hypothetical protein